MKRVCSKCNKPLKEERSPNSKICDDCLPNNRRKQQKEYRQRRKEKMALDVDYRNKAYWNTFKSEAKRRKIKIEINFQEFTTILKTNCFYCNDIVDTIGIDRIDNDKHYTFDNVIRCCVTCNKMKSNIEPYKFFEHISKIAKNLSKLKISIITNKIDVTK